MTQLVDANKLKPGGCPRTARGPRTAREKKQRQEAGRMRDSTIAGYQNAIEGKTHKFNGDLQALLKKVK